MNQQIKISYTIDLEDILEEIYNLLSGNNFIDLIKEIDIVKRNLSLGDIQNSIFAIKNIRKKLYRNDLRLDDCCQILEGYQTLLEKEKEKENVSDGKENKIS